MIRSDSVNGLFSRSRCPFDDEGEQCKRPFCPFFHPFTGASTILIKVKEEVQDDDIIVVLEKVGPPKSSLTSQVESHHPIAPNPVMTQQSQNDPIPGFFFTSTLLSSLDQYACGYLGYLAPNISSAEHVNPPIHEHIFTSHKLTPVNEQSTSGLPSVLNNSSKAKDIESGSISLSHHKKQKEKVASAPSYTPTPIVQLEREEEERKKRRELAERQKNIRNRLKHQDIAKSKQNKNIVDKNLIDPIDQIMVTQEILLKDQREQKLEELTKIEIEKKRHKERMEKQDEMKKNKKGIKLKSGETCSGLILAGAPRNIMKISNCKQQNLKRSDQLNCKSNDDVWLSKKSSSDIMEEYEKKVEDWKERINKPIEKDVKERTVINDILTTKRQQHSTSSFNNDFGNVSKKLGFYNIMEKKKKSRLNEKCEFGINENVKMLSNIDKSIGILEEEIRQSNNKSNKSSQPSASVSNELKLNIKNHIDKKKKIPIWRKKNNAPTDIILENKHNNVRKLSDDIINSLFEGDEMESSTKKDNNNKKHFYESIDLVHKRQRTSSNNERNKKQKLENEEVDSEILKEKQALVDLLSDNVLTPTMSPSSTSSVSVVPATPSPIASPTQKPKSPIQLNVKNSSSNNIFHSEIPSTISTNLNCSTNNNNNFSDIKHTLPSTLKKGEQRKAHLNISSKGDQQKLIPLDPNNKKVSIQIRQTKLRIIYEEYVKICANDPKLAIESAQNEEKGVLDRCSSKIGYLSAIPNLIKRLRNAATNNLMPKSSSGRHADSVTLGLQKAKHIAQHKASHLSESDIYNSLQLYLLSTDQLWDNGYPRWATSTQENDDEFDLFNDTPKNIVEIREFENDSKREKSFVPDSDLRRVCARCGIEYQLKSNGDYTSSGECIYHWGRAWKKKIQGVVEARYTCCQSTLDVQGCVVAVMHVTQTLRLSTLEQYVDTPKPYGVGDPRSKKVYAMDCEMVYTNWGPEVARVSVVDVLGELILDVIVRPENTLIDPNSKFSGLNSEQVLHADCDLNKAHKHLFELINSETILIGHSLESDLRALRLVHNRVVDTSIVFPHRLGPPYKRALKTLASEFLQIIIQEDEGGHDSKEDALACMRIMLRKVRTDLSINIA